MRTKASRLAICAIAFGLCSFDAQAQDGAVKALFEKHNLIGIFASNCRGPASKQNNYFVHRLLDPDHLQRDVMEGEPWIRHDEHYHVDFAVRASRAEA